ncbi:EAL domain-containing protein [Pelomonas sp. KK5]|uniref:EAL domain-containing protein n=1 Tax=Pelomonas sp. KK5 TaxID=1855730 RepID=UPI00097BF126|nr:EAL domain-containing protein [Pelomonas sp. KK5]
MRVLLVEDEAHDAELAVRTLRKAGLDCTSLRVDTEDAFRAALRDFVPDIILSDFSMPLFDGMSALAIARQLVPDTPFIFVSGTIGEEYAINALKNGATDYVLKNNMARLGPAVERALDDVRRAREQRSTAAALHHSEQRFLLAASTGDVWDWVIDTGESYIPHQWKQRHGYADEQIANRWSSWFELLHPDDREAVQAAIDFHLQTSAPYEVEFRTRDRDGGYRWSQAKGKALRDAAGQPTYMAGSIVDITERKIAEIKVNRLNRVYALLSGIGSLIVRAQSRDELFAEACRVAVEAGGFMHAWVALVEGPAGALSTPVALAERAATSLAPGVAQAARDWVLATLAPEVVAGGQAAFKDDLGSPSAELRGLHAAAALPIVVEGQVLGLLVLHTGEADFFDAAEQRLLGEMSNDLSFALDHIHKSEKLSYLAFYDALTGLANRSLFMERLTQYLNAARRAHRKLAVLALNIDRFKTVVESLGYAGGDDLLKQLAQRLIAHAGDSDRYARIDADHFAIIVPDMRSEEELARMIERYTDLYFGEPFHIAGAELRISARAGIALFPNDGDGADELYQHALSAAAKAKTRGEGYLFYSQDMSRKIAGALALENRLRRAVRNDEFVLHYQPKVDGATGRILGVEALIRWQDPENGLIPPAQFIPLLEEIGLIVEVGAWAMQQAVRDHKRWRALHLTRVPRVAVNVSAIQLRRADFETTVRNAIELGGGHPCMDLEITESLVMEDIEANIVRLTRVRDLGVSIAVDDFGTGYSSLRYLAALPVQTLKIDRSFVHMMLNDASTMTLVSTVISLAHSLQLKVVAEGVETEKQAQCLRKLNCDEMQGYWFSPPLPFDRMVELLTSQSEVGIR